MGAITIIACVELHFSVDHTHLSVVFIGLATNGKYRVQSPMTACVYSGPI